jgi:hypothetical protein
MGCNGTRDGSATLISPPVGEMPGRAEGADRKLRGVF